MDLVIGRKRLKEGKDSVPINDPRLMRVLKEMIYFSEIFPKQYHTRFKKELLESIDINKQQAMNDLPQSLQATLKSHSTTTGTPIESTPQPDPLHLYWSNEYILASNAFLEHKFGFIYSHLFLNKLFHEKD